MSVSACPLSPHPLGGCHAAWPGGPHYLYLLLQAPISNLLQPPSQREHFVALGTPRANLVTR